MEAALTAQTSQDYAAGATSMSRPRSVFDTVGDLAIYRQRWQQRCLHYTMLRSYYEGTVYDAFPELVRALKLYSGIRQIFGPLRRAVRVDVAKAPGGWKLDPGNEEEGRPPVPKNVAAAVEQIRTWSSYRAAYSRAVLHGAVAGEFGLLVIDDRMAKTVSIVPLRPDEVVTGTFADGTPFGLIVKCNLVDRGGQYEYAQLITPNTITTFRNGMWHDYDGGGAKRPNLLGFVPLLLSPYLAGESGIGENAFAGTQELLDRVNDAASQALDVIQRNAEPLTVFSGVTEVDFDEGNNAITLSKADAKAYTLAPNLVIDHALQLIEKVLNEFKNLLPQLILDVLTSRNDLAYDTVLTLCMELIDHMRDVRTHVDAAIETAERWALIAGQQMGLFPGVDPAQHRLDPERPVIEPTPGQKLQMEQAQVGLEGARKALTAPAQAAPGQESKNAAEEA
jgi:hypothetical protein